jgi:predicted RNA-binding Zn-ribbon protein involved in translation (DUF1610 family)
MKEQSARASPYVQKGRRNAMETSQTSTHAPISLGTDATGYRCQDCRIAFRQDQAEHVYECRNGHKFSSSKAIGRRGHQCPVCKQLGRKVSDTGCPNCGSADLRPLALATCPECGASVAEEAMATHRQRHGVKMKGVNAHRLSRQLATRKVTRTVSISQPSTPLYPQAVDLNALSSGTPAPAVRYAVLYVDPETDNLMAEEWDSQDVSEAIRNVYQARGWYAWVMTLELHPLAD